MINPERLANYSSNSFLNQLLTYLPEQTFLLSFGDRLPEFPEKCNTEEIFYIPTKQRLYLAYDLPSLDHELAHLVEINREERILEIDFGFERMGQKYQQYIFGNSRRFFAAVIRETKTRAIQARINRAVETDRRNVWINNNIWFSEHSHFRPCGDKLFPFGRFANLEQLRDYAGDLFTRTFQRYSEERIESVLNQRMTRIKNWMESSN